MGLHFFGTGEVLVAEWWWTPCSSGQVIAIADEFAARRYVRLLREQPGGLHRARSLVSQKIPVAGARYEDADVLRVLERWLATGEVRLVLKPRDVLPTFGEKEEEAPFSRDVFVSPPPVIEPSPPPEEATFPTGIDAAAIAAILREAAKSGVPFCEECLKKKLLAKAREPNTFPEDLDAMAAAMVMKAAAEWGTPFCEECMKHRLQTSRGASGAAPPSGRAGESGGSPPPPMGVSGGKVADAPENGASA